MSIFSFLTGTSATAEKAVDGIVSGLDAMVFTDEEKSQASMKVLDFKLKYAEATQGMSISRRVIAFTISAAWLLLVVLTVAVGLIAGGKSDEVGFLMQIMTDVVMQPFSIIVGFYFLAHVVGSARK
jgi:hypothetical protein